MRNALRWAGAAAFAYFAVRLFVLGVRGDGFLATLPLFIGAVACVRVCHDSWTARG
jgi:hypothetical protein